MKASDLDLFELLDLNPARGSIRFKDRRMLLWDADAFGTLRRELIDSVGLERGRQIIRRFGFANGYRDGLTIGEMFHWDDDTEWWLSCPALQNHQGKGNAIPRRTVIDREAGTIEVEVVWKDSYEAAQHLRLYGRAEAPVCWSLSGYASGFATALMGEEVYVVEKECVAQGAPHCLVVGRTKRAWGADGVRHAADYEAQNLRNRTGGEPHIVFPEVIPMAALERHYILQVLDRFDGNRTHTARALGIGANTLWRKLKSWGVPPARGAGANGHAMPPRGNGAGGNPPDPNRRPHELPPGER